MNYCFCKIAVSQDALPESATIGPLAYRLTNVQEQMTHEHSLCETIAHIRSFWLDNLWHVYGTGAV